MLAAVGGLESRIRRYVFLILSLFFPYLFGPILSTLLLC